MFSVSTKTTPRVDPLVLTIAIGAFAVVVLRTAWICDDAYITLRTVDNFVNGHGLRWNVAERVQTYTHPLWMFLLSAAYFVTREAFITTALVGVVVSTVAVAIAARSTARTTPVAVLFVGLCLFSRAFVDYSTSGLENPLSHLLLAAFCVILFSRGPTPRNIAVLTSVASLAAVNRPDTILLYLPVLAYIFLTRFSLRMVAALAIGMLPLVLWESFSLVYYGFLVPNTAIAKLNTDIPPIEIYAQGGLYLLNSLRNDFVTLPVIVLATGVTLMKREARSLALLAGVLLYVVYIVRIGGDFMSGRFLTVPFFAAAILLVRNAPLSGRVLVWPAIAFAATAGFFTPMAPFLTGANFGETTHGFKDTSGVGDERRFYFRSSSLAQIGGERAIPSHGYANEGRRYREDDRQVTAVHGSVGYRGYFGGPKIHIIDYYALGDPLLARLPAGYNPTWRVGHFRRHIPEGYEQTLRIGEDRFRDRDLADYYAALQQITRSPIWSRERWNTILHMNLGHLDFLIDRDAYRFPLMQRITIDRLGRRRSEGEAWNAPGTISFRSHGLEISLRNPTHAPEIGLSLSNNDHYRVLFLRDKDILGTVNVAPTTLPKPGLALHQITVPPRAQIAGYNTLRLIPHQGDRRYSIGHLRLLAKDDLTDPPADL